MPQERWHRRTNVRLTRRRFWSRQGSGSGSSTMRAWRSSSPREIPATASCTCRAAESSFPSFHIPGNRDSNVISGDGYEIVEREGWVEVLAQNQCHSRYLVNLLFADGSDIVGGISI